MTAVGTGEAWSVDAYGCDPARLRSVVDLAAVFAAVVAEVRLSPIAPAVWHAFPGEGGVTGFLLLQESHLAVHTFPERAFAAFDLYCCRERPAWGWDARLAALLGAARVVVRRQRRGGDGA
jgi:S-adenosylmethionine decarboxylase